MVADLIQLLNMKGKKSLVYEQLRQKIQFGKQTGAA